MKYPFRLICLLLPIICSCERNTRIEAENIHHIPVDPRAYVELKFSDFFDTTLMVPLEVTANSLIGEVSKAVTTEDWLYVLDRTVAESLFVFDYRGRLHRFFFRHGGRPGGIPSRVQLFLVGEWGNRFHNRSFAGKNFGFLGKRKISF